MKYKITQGHIMAGVGFFLILLTALQYLFDWEAIWPLFIIGLVFVVIGMNQGKK